MKHIEPNNYYSRAWLEDEQSSRSTGYIFCYEFEGKYEVRLADCFGTYSLKGSARGRKTFCKQLDSILEVLNRDTTRKKIGSSILYNYFIKFCKSEDELSVTVSSVQKKSRHEKKLFRYINSITKMR